MATFSDSVKLPKATEHFSTFNLSCDHVTTQDFFKLKPVYTRVLVPGQSINVEMSHITRLAPLVKPFYGSVTMINRAFFVPFRTIMEGFNEFIDDTPYFNGSSQSIINHVPTIYMSDICTFLAQSTYSEINETTYDFAFKRNSSTVEKRKFTSLGRYASDVLHCLGYQIDFSAMSGQIQGQTDLQLSALPLLAFCRIYTDYFENTNFAPSSLQNFYKGVNKVLDYQFLNSMFTYALYASYENDYLTASWSNPSSPYNSVRSSFTITDSSLPNDDNPTQSHVASLNNTNYSTPYIERTDGHPTVNSLTTYILTALQSLSDYMKRHQISGYRAIDRFKARFGITLPDAKLNRSIYLGKSETPIEITDVTSTSDTDGAVLGQYSGFGISRNGNSGTFSYQTDEYGIFVILSIISPIHASYANGIDRHLLDISKLDLYTPEFDGLGCQAIANAEVKCDFVGPQEENPAGVWAYIPRYAHYKCGRDILSGDFKVNSLNANLKQFHIFREFPTTVPTHNLDFCTGHTEDYTRIFNDTSLGSDHFFTSFHFNVRSDAPMSSLFENYHFDEAGKEIEMKVGGTRLS